MKETFHFSDENNGGVDKGLMGEAGVKGNSALSRYITHYIHMSLVVILFLL